jgi:RNA polymerase sigma-70 factor (ECF subfamily)
MTGRDQAPDEVLVSGVRAGDEKAFEALMERYRSRVFRLVLGITGNAAAAEEVLQEVFLVVFKKLDSFEGKAAFSTWLYRVAANAALMRMRKEERGERISLDDLEPELAGEDEAGGVAHDRIITRESLVMIEKAAEHLPPELKVIFVLRDLEGFSNEETAEIMNMSVAAVKSRLHRAREYLRPRLKGLYRDMMEE